MEPRSPLPDPAAGAPASDATLALLVGAVYEHAPLEERGRILDQLLRPLGVLSLFAVSGGLFARLRLRGGWENFHVRTDDLHGVRASDVVALVDYVQQVSADAVDGLAQLLATSPRATGSAAAALLVTLLLRRARSRRGRRSGDDASAGDAA
jgi:hypothetical protein